MPIIQAYTQSSMEYALWHQIGKSSVQLGHIVHSKDILDIEMCQVIWGLGLYMFVSSVIRPHGGFCQWAL